MQVSEKQKVISQFFFEFSKFTFNFEHFQKKGDPHSLCIFQPMDSERSC